MRKRNGLCWRAALAVSLLGATLALQCSHRDESGADAAGEQPASLHQRLDIARWKELFNLKSQRAAVRRFAEEQRRQYPLFYENETAFEEHIRLMSPGGEIITGPRHIATVELVREEAIAGRAAPASVPVDVFVWALGEAPVRSYTKVGGLPYWPARRPWPLSSSGRPLTFVAQICFADSRDLVGELPGDILLLFAPGVYGEEWSEFEGEGLRFEWLALGLSSAELIQGTAIPEQSWHIETCWAVIHRTRDYFGSWKGLFDDYDQPYDLDLIEGTKIGGRPQWVQGPPRTSPGRFLATLGSIHPDRESRFPFLNRETPYVWFSEEGEHVPGDLLMWGDVGSLYLFLKDDGAISWTIQEY